MELELSWIDAIFGIIIVLIVVAIHKWANWYMANMHKYDKDKFTT